MTFSQLEEDYEQLMFKSGPRSPSVTTPDAQNAAPQRSLRRVPGALGSHGPWHTTACSLACCICGYADCMFLGTGPVYMIPLHRLRTRRGTLHI